MQIKSPREVDNTNTTKQINTTTPLNKTNNIETKVDITKLLLINKNYHFELHQPVKWLVIRYSSNTQLTTKYRILR